MTDSTEPLIVGIIDNDYSGTAWYLVRDPRWVQWVTDGGAPPADLVAAAVAADDSIADGASQADMAVPDHLEQTCDYETARVNLASCAVPDSDAFDSEVDARRAAPHATVIDGYIRE